MRNHLYTVAFAAFAVALATSSFAQTAPPPQQAPTRAPQQAPQIRAPTAQVRPNLTLNQNIPVAIVWPGHRMTGASIAGISGGREVGPYPEADHDNDGVNSIARGGLDCDDNDVRRSPERTEVADTQGVDEDCDISTVGAQDLDFDGFTSWRAMNIIRDVNGTALAVVRGPDCDDNYADTNPGTPEVVGDDRDNNCDGDIDIVRAGGHRDYCGPTERISAANALSPCVEGRR